MLASPQVNILYILDAEYLQASSLQNQRYDHDFNRATGLTTFWRREEWEMYTIVVRNDTGITLGDLLRALRDNPDREKFLFAIALDTESLEEAKEMLKVAAVKQVKELCRRALHVQSMV